MELKVGDNHCHLNPVKGMGVAAFARRFKNAGGWFLALVNLTTWSYGLRVENAGSYERMYRLTVDTARELREHGLRVAVIVGPHPAELAELVRKGVKLSRAEQMVIEAYKLAAKYVEKGEAQGLGEVGRPHWPAPRELVEACNRVTEFVADLARELDCVVHIHAERGGIRTIEDMASRFKGVKRAVLHHAEGAYAKDTAERGLVPSIPAKEGEVKAALRCSSFVVESDFLDDPRRPGAVVAPWSIGRLFARLVRKGLIGGSEARRILVENIARLYGIEG